MQRSRDDRGRGTISPSESYVVFESGHGYGERGPSVAISRVKAEGDSCEEKRELCKWAVDFEKRVVLSEIGDSECRQCR